MFQYLYFTLNMEAAKSSKTLLSYITTLCHNPDPYLYLRLLLQSNSSRVTLKMESGKFFEELVSYHVTIRCHTPSPMKTSNLTSTNVIQIPWDQHRIDLFPP